MDYHEQGIELEGEQIVKTYESVKLKYKTTHYFNGDIYDYLLEIFYDDDADHIYYLLKERHKSITIHLFQLGYDIYFFEPTNSRLQDVNTIDQNGIRESVNKKFNK